MEKGGNMCGRVRERGVFSVWDDRRERKNASRRRRGKVGTLKKHKGSTGELSMPYAPPGADSVLEASVERGGDMVLYICNTFYNFNGRPSM